MLELFGIEHPPIIIFIVFGMGIGFIFRHWLISTGKFPTLSNLFPNALWIYILIVVVMFLVNKSTLPLLYRIALIIGFAYTMIAPEKPIEPLIAEDFFHPQAVLNEIFHKILDGLPRLILVILGIFSGVALGKII